jgi:hypothetical protein
MTRVLFRLDVSLALAQLAPINMNAKVDGGGKKPLKRNVVCTQEILNPN